MVELSETKPLSTRALRRRLPWTLLIPPGLLILLMFVFRDGLILMVQWWNKEEYSHGYMIPLVAAFLAWQRLERLPAAITPSSWWGLLFLVQGLLALVVGELSALYTIIQYGFLICVFGLLLMTLGLGGTALLWAPFAYLIFMIPLPNFLYNNLSSQLQLISSELGVTLIRLFGISVYLEGNVIDLGLMKLQVVEACSGLRYLFPLMSFGFLIACLFRGPLWQRVLLFLSTIPITVLMNSLRIGFIGITVERWGRSAAEGLLHDFEGWVVFMGCVGVLFLEIGAFHLLSRDGRHMLDRLDLELPQLTAKPFNLESDWRNQRPLLLGAILLVIITPWIEVLGSGTDIHPERLSLSRFPLLHRGWSGREMTLDEDVREELRLTDYIKVDYTDADSSSGLVNLYIAWYESQKKGASIHSPRSCIPGGGWRIESISQRTLPVTHVSGTHLQVNRVLIRKGDMVQLVYYWFEGRHRNITDEYIARWYIFWDSLTRSRSDGALVRVITFLPALSEVDKADQKLTSFISDFYPLLPDYVP